MSGRLLVITYHYPPDGAVGGLRWAGMTRGLAELGWSSWVLTAAQGSSPDVPGVVVTRRARRTTLNDRYASMRAAAIPARPRTPSGTAATGADAGLRPPRSRPLKSLREAVSTAGLLLTLPDVGRGWMLRAVSAAREIIRTVKPDVVITSGPPDSAHVVGRLACLGTSVARYVDMRDPLITSTYPPLGPVHGPMRWSIEQISFASAAGAICVTAEAAAELATRHPRLKVAHIPNGVDLSTLPPAGTAAPFDGLTLAHVGTLYHRRDPSIALRAMHRFLARTPAARGALKLRFVGSIEPQFLDKLTATSRDLDLTANVEICGTMPRNDALEIMRRSHITLVFAQAQLVQVPAKLYEAAAVARDVIVITEPESSSGSEAVRIGAAVAAPDDDEGLARLLERAWKGDRLNGGRARDLAAIDYRSIAKRLTQLLERATPDSSV